MLLKQKQIVQKTSQNETFICQNTFKQSVARHRDSEESDVSYFEHQTV